MFAATVASGRVVNETVISRQVKLVLFCADILHKAIAR